MNSRGRPAPLPLPSRQVFTVTEITRGIRNALQNAFETVLVQGEVANYKGVHPPSGNHYFSLKDSASQIDVVIFSDRITKTIRDILQNGIALQIEGDLTVFEKQGRYQLRAFRIEPVGYGALQARFDALKKKLEQEGLFAVQRKRPLPVYPTRIGIVTSTTGAALTDMVRILQGHAPYAKITVADTRVQGEGAARDIQNAMQSMMFEPNSSLTWEKVRSAVTNYLHGLWKQGALLGSTEKEAYFVKIGEGVAGWVAVVGGCAVR